MKLSAILLGAALFAVPATAFADSPQNFLRDALQGANSEIMLGRLAQDRAATQGVKDFGRTLENDHSQARNEVLQVGRRYGIRFNRDTSWDAQQLRDRLQGLRGREFDRVFINTMVQDHQADIAKFRDQARERHGAVSRLAQSQLPTLQQHLDIAQNLDRQLQRGPAFGNRDRDRDWDRDWNRNNNGYSFRNNGR
jgi:putative membrane protein